MIPKSLAVAIVCVVTAVWLANFIAQFLVHGYQVDGYVHGIFFSVVGGALVASRGSSDSAAPKGPADPPDPPTKLGPGPGPPEPPPMPDLPPRSQHRHRAPLIRVLIPLGAFA